MRSLCPWLVVVLLALACSAGPESARPRVASGGASSLLDAGDAPSADAANAAWASGGAGSGGSSGALGTSGAAGASGALGASGVAGAAGSTSDAGSGCQYEKVYEKLGTVLEVKPDASFWQMKPLAGKGFYCARFEFDMQTADTLAGIKASGGCPIFTAIGGFGAHGTLLAGGLFKVYKAQATCPLGPTRLEIDAFSGAEVEPAPYVLGEQYHVTIEVIPFTASLTLSQNGQQVGPTMSASVAGATVADTVDARFTLGQESATQNAYYPNYGAIYSNVVIWADIAP